MIIWTVANQKGGVGKTTTAVSLAGLLAGRGHNTLLVDVDPHGSMTSYFGLDPDSVEDSVYTLFQDTSLEHTERLIRNTRFDHLYLMPASTALTTLDRQLGAKAGMGLVLSRAFKPLADQFDNIIIDCPPMLGVLMVNALAACEKLLMPVQTEFLALKGLERMLHTLKMINHTRQPPLPHLIIPTMFDRRTRASQETLQYLQDNYKEELWDKVVPVDTQFREASRAGIPLSMMNAKTRGTQAYSELLDSLIGPESSENEIVAAV